MALPGNKNFSDYDNYITDSKPTTSAQAQDYFRNQAELLKAVIDCDFWQPETTYQPGDVVKSDSMPNGTEAVMVAAKASVTSNVEPSWGAVGGANISDGACFWKLRWRYWSKEVASVDDMKNGTSNDKLVTPKLARLGQTATNRLPNTAYSVGNVVYVDSNLSVALKCTTTGTTSNTELDVSGNNIGDTVTDGSVVWQVCNRTSDVTSVNGKTGDVVVDLPVGHMYFSVEPNVPAGRLPALGATYNRSLYADLWAWANSVDLVKSESEWQAIANANDGNCAYYSSGDGSTTFRVPSIKCWVKGASSVDEVGSYLEAGLPNITGDCGAPHTDDGGTNFSGAFKIVGTASLIGRGGGSVRDAWNADFDASRSNSIYGNSDTVQPPSIVGQWLIVAYGVAHNIGEADVANVMQAVEQVQTGLGKVDGIIDYIVESYRNGTEWYEVYKSGKVRQGGYTKTATNGIVTITLLKEMQSADYDVKITPFTAEKADWGIAVINNTNATYKPTTIKFTARGSITGYLLPVQWTIEGQGA